MALLFLAAYIAARRGRKYLDNSAPWIQALVRYILPIYENRGQWIKKMTISLVVSETFFLSWSSIGECPP